LELSLRTCAVQLAVEVAASIALLHLLADLELAGVRVVPPCVLGTHLYLISLPERSMTYYGGVCSAKRDGAAILAYARAIWTC